jgi:hypothetical protein
MASKDLPREGAQEPLRGVGKKSVPPKHANVYCMRIIMWMAEGTHRETLLEPLIALLTLPSPVNIPRIDRPPRPPPPTRFLPPHFISRHLILFKYSWVAVLSSVASAKIRRRRAWIAFSQDSAL